MLNEALCGSHIRWDWLLIGAVRESAVSLDSVNLAVFNEKEI